jgi:hypothetical protein
MSIHFYPFQPIDEMLKPSENPAIRICTPADERKCSLPIYDLVLTQ